MFSTKADLDKYATSVLNKIPSDKERAAKGLFFATHYFQMKEFDSAKRHVLEYLAYNHADASAHKLLGDIQLALGKSDAAIAAYGVSLEHDPNQPSVKVKFDQLNAGGSSLPQVVPGPAGVSMAVSPSSKEAIGQLPPPKAASLAVSGALKNGLGAALPNSPSTSFSAAARSAKADRFNGSKLLDIGVDVSSPKYAGDIALDDLNNLHEMSTGASVYHSFRTAVGLTSPIRTASRSKNESLNGAASFHLVADRFESAIQTLNSDVVEQLQSLHLAVRSVDQDARRLAGDSGGVRQLLEQNLLPELKSMSAELRNQSSQLASLQQREEQRAGTRGGGNGSGVGDAAAVVAELRLLRDALHPANRADPLQAAARDFAAVAAELRALTTLGSRALQIQTDFLAEMRAVADQLRTIAAHPPAPVGWAPPLYAYGGSSLFAPMAAALSGQTAPTQPQPRQPFTAASPQHTHSFADRRSPPPSAAAPLGPPKPLSQHAARPMSASDDDVIFVGSVSPSAEQVHRARQLQLPDSFYLYEQRKPCKGCAGCFDGELSGNELQQKVAELRQCRTETKDEPAVSSTTKTAATTVAASACVTTSSVAMTTTAATRVVTSLATTASTKAPAVTASTKAPTVMSSTMAPAVTASVAAAKPFAFSAAAPPSTDAAAPTSFLFGAATSKPLLSFASITSSSTAGAAFGGFKWGDAPTSSSNLFGPSVPLFSGLQQPKPATSASAEQPHRPDSPEDGAAPEEFEPTGDFKPLIALPELQAKVTGEEDEDKMFGERCKLYRWNAPTKEWKERGTGELRILQSRRDVNKFRLLMRRDQVLKICANHAITPDIKLTRIGNADAADKRVWTWSAQDYSEEELKLETFSVRFRQEELAQQFYDVFQRCVDKTAQPQWAAAAASGASAAPSVATTAPTPSASSVPADKPSLSSLFKTDTGSWTCDACLVRNKPDAATCAACQTPKAGSASAAAAAATPSGASLATPASGRQGRPATGAAAPTAAATATTTATAAAASDSTTDDMKTRSLFGGALFGAAPLFATSSPAGGLFGGTAFGSPSTLGRFASAVDDAADANSSKTDDAKSVEQQSSRIGFGFTPSAASGGVAFGSGRGSPLLSFGSVANQAAGQPLFGGASTSAAPPVATQTLFGKPLIAPSPVTTAAAAQSAVNQTDDDDEAADDYEPDAQFQPVIALPELQPKVTGEESEEKLFGERCRLYRWFPATKEWKERGTGELRILQDHNHSNRCRLLMRRDQVLKICANHLMTPDLRLARIGNADVADKRVWTWSANDFSEEQLQMHTFSVRFRQEDLAQQFYDVFMRCVENAQKASISGTGGESIASSTAASTASMPTAAGDDTAASNGDSGDADEYDVMFEGRATLFADGDTPIFGGTLRINFSDDLEAYYAHAVAAENTHPPPGADYDGLLRCNHVISKEISLNRNGRECTWTALDHATSVPSRRQFRAVFDCDEDADAFERTFNEGIRIAIDQGIESPDLNEPVELTTPIIARPSATH